ncbi:MAG: Fpg/Nei family DNA glycosylase [Intrasporangium sp.]|uniref:Fpg/Nei family DNA glycosylase n=1 Tax=Intrasporangium sp. TaxID=1925024 RepID=UPI002649F4B9|nr:DNA-formamidopyrimidine glycosylase family protein [Intrasporangium sp.]MDN5797699.1 Fpg/Nei family DNA glycosylase [Intrasporangium sp.]
MPEGHTIHALADRLTRAFGDSPVTATSPQGRFTADAALLDGRVLEDAAAAGKHLFVDIGDRILHVHLGLIGTFPVIPITDDKPPDPVGTVRLRLVGQEHYADLRGPMVCALIDLDTREAIRSALGPDPLDPAADPGVALMRIRRTRRGIGALLLDQAVVAGIGNVYRCEVLHRHRIDPFAAGTELTEELWWTIWADLVRLLPLGVAFGQILTLAEQVREAEQLVADGRAGPITRSLTGERLGDYFERRFATYQRAGEPCHRCGTILRGEKVSGRRLYWCPGCQTRH